MPSKYAELGERAAKEYIEQDVPLNDSVEKIAKENDLNSDEIKRVVERANTNTFLEMFKSADDKTFEFDLADPSLTKIAEDDEKMAKSNDFVSDYNTPPENDRDTQTIEKAASEFDIDESNSEEDLHEHVFSNPSRAGRVRTKLSSAIEQLEDELFDLKVRGNEYIDRFKKEAEKAFKNGYEPEDVAKAVKQANVDEACQELLVEELADFTNEKYATINEWTKHNSINADSDGVVNTDHDLVQIPQKINEWADKTANKKESLNEAKEMLELAKKYEKQYGDN